VRELWGEIFYMRSPWGNEELEKALRGYLKAGITACPACMALTENPGWGTMAHNEISF
jgi:hypothetical protein